MDTALFWKVAAELPIVLLFAFFVFKLIDRFDKLSRERDSSWLSFLSGEQEKNRENWKRFHDGLSSTSRSIDRLSTILLYHDATVRGLNPSSIGSTEELIRILKGKSET